MEKKTSTVNYSLIAGIMFATAAVLAIINLFRFSVSFVMILRIAGFAVSAFALITNRRDFVLIIGFALLMICDLSSGIGGANGFFILISWLSSIFICGVFLTEYLNEFKEKVGKLWFVPGVCYSVSTLIWLLQIKYFYFAFPLFVVVVQDIVTIIGIFLAVLWVVYPNGLPKSKGTVNAGPQNMSAESAPKAAAPAPNAAESAPAPAAVESYCGLVKHTLLLLLTFGIWHLIWIYKITEYTNAVKDEEPRVPVNKLLLCIFVPFYIIYWTYQTAQRIDKMAAAKGIPSDMSTLCLILELFVPIIPPILLQDKLNSIVMSDDAQSAGKTDVKDQAKGTASFGAADELKKYKELLDMEIITQDEFDFKKKQLLNL